MKRFLSLTLVAIMLFSTLMFTSCAEVKSLINKVLGREEVRYTIAADEWAKVDSINNFTMIRSNKSDDYTSKQIFKYTTDALYMYQGYTFEEYDGIINEAYVDFKSQYVIQLDEQGNWVGVYVEGLSEMYKIDKLFDIAFEDLVYDEDTKAYVYTDEWNQLYSFYFENGNLVRVMVASTNAEINETAIIENIGTTTVTLPQYTIVDDYSVTEEEWNANFDQTNFSMDAQVNSQEISKTGQYKVINNTLWLSLDGYNEYITVIDGVVYYIQSDDDGKYYAKQTGTSVDEMYNSIGDLASDSIPDLFSYSNFSYDAFTGAYKRNYINENLYYSVSVYFVDGIITKINISEENMDTSSVNEYQITIYDIGETSFELPEYVIVEQ